MEAAAQPHPTVPPPLAARGAGVASARASAWSNPALQLAERRSFRDVTVEEIAKASGLSRSAFYTHFQDKQHLLMASLEGPRSGSRMLRELRDSARPPPARAKGGRGHRLRLRRAAGLLRLAAEVSAYDEEIRAVWLAVAERFVGSLAEQIRSEQDVGLILETLEPRSTAGRCSGWRSGAASSTWGEGSGGPPR